MATGHGSEDASGLLKSFFVDHRADIGAVGMYAAAVGVLVLATPLAVQTLVGTAAFGTVLQPIVVVAMLLLGGLVLAGVLRVLKAYAVAVIQRRMFVRTVGRPKLAFLLSAVKSRVQRGRERLRQALEDCCEIALDVRGKVVSCEPRPDGKLPGSCCGSAAADGAPTRRGGASTSV